MFFERINRVLDLPTKFDGNPLSLHTLLIRSKKANLPEQSEFVTAQLFPTFYDIA